MDLVPFAMGPDWGDFLTFRRCGLSDPDMWPVVLIDWEDGRAVSVGSSLRDALVRWSEGDWQVRGSGVGPEDAFLLYQVVERDG